MLIARTILTVIVCGFYFVAISQKISSETLTGKGLYGNEIFLSKAVSSFILSSYSDTLPVEIKKNAALPAFDETKKLTPVYEKNIGKHLASLTAFLKEENKKSLQTPFVLQQADLGYNSLSDQPLDHSFYLGNFTVNTNWMIAGIPIQADLNNQYFQDVSDFSRINTSLRFDKDAYLESLQKKLANKLNPSSLIDQFRDPVLLLKEQMTGALRTELAELSRSYNGLLDKEVRSIIENPSLFTQDMKELKENTANRSNAQQALQDEARLTMLQQQLNLGQQADTATMNQLSKGIVKAKGMEQVLNTLTEHKNKWQSSGLLKKIKDAELLKKIRLTRLMNDPGFIRKQAREQLSLKGLERFFLKVNRLNLGRDALSLSPMSFQHFLHNGVSTEFLSNKGKTIMLVAGKQKDRTAIQDYVFTDNLNTNNGTVKAIRMSLLSSAMSSSHISLSQFNQSMGGMSAIPTPSADLRKILVTTISNELAIGEKGIISVDLSRSSASYNEGQVNADSVLHNKKNFGEIFSPNDLFSNTALALKYANENMDRGLSYQFNFSKVTNGYTNPGNSFLSSGSTEFGTNLRKSVLKNILQFGFRGNFRQYQFNDKLDDKWKNIYLVFDAKWRMKKGRYLSFRYQPNRMFRVADGKSNVTTSIDRLSVDGNLYHKFRHIVYRNYLGLTFQKNRYAISPAESIGNTSLQLNSAQNISLGKNSLFLNTNYIYSANHSQYLFFNSSLNTDVGFSYQLLKRIICSSGIVYSSVDNWYRQLGIRQSLSGEINEKFYINVYVDARKNLQMIQPIWSSPVRADISLRYILKK